MHGFFGESGTGMGTGIGTKTSHYTLYRSMTPKTFVKTINPNVAEKLQRDLIDQGFEISIPQNTLFSAKKKGVTCTLYKSGKLMVQGKEMAPFIEFYLEPEILGSFEFTHGDIDIDCQSRIGIDESGKGDFFGPLCVAGVHAEGDEVLRLKKIGVKDSKAMTPAAIEKVSKLIRADYRHHIVKINPLKYNELHKQFGNLNLLLAWGHATTIEHLVSKTGCHTVIIDQFAAEHVVETALKRKHVDVTLSQRHRGEEDLVVAAASIVARQTFVDGLEKLSEELGVKLPKGASSITVEIGKKLVKQYGPEVLPKVAKVHFKTTNLIL